MCGIAGKLYFQQQAVQHEEIATLTQKIAHRGPDDTGIFVQGSVGLGHCRLSIIDLSPAGHQPMSDSEKKIWITFNGEIYNFQELRLELEKEFHFHSQSDTEVIVYLYKKYGYDCLTKMRGMFAFAIWDSEKKLLFIARDRVGKKPLKYYLGTNFFVFSSELKAFLSDPQIPKQIDYAAIDAYLTFGYVPAPKTGFIDIHKLEPGHYLVVRENGEVEKKQYWMPNFSSKIELSEKEWEQRIEAELKTAVRLRMIADVPIGVHLSGGIDSSLITALMATQSTEPINTFSVGFSEKKYNELPYAKMVAEKYGTHHHEIMLEPDALHTLSAIAYQYEEPFADASILPTWFLSEATRRQVTVALNGDGGDELFGGYYRYQAMALYPLLKLLPAKNLLSHFTSQLGLPSVTRALQNYSPSAIKFYTNIISYFSDNQKKYLLTKKFSEQNGDVQEKNILAKIWEEDTNLEWLDQWLSLGIKTHLPYDLLVKVDIASMAHAIEIRSPLLDSNLVELTAQMPSRLKIKHWQKKYLLNKIATRYIPAECINRPKQGFSTPLDYWFRGKFASYLEEKITDSAFLALGFEKKYIVNLLEEHANKQNDHSKKLWTLLMLAEWHAQFFK